MKTFFSRRGFTLLELLAAVAVFAVLVALLVPTVGSARDKANTAGCASNLRSIGGLMTTYAAEHDGYLPIPCEEKISTREWPYGTNKEWPFNNWMGQLAPYAGISLKGNDSYDKFLNAVYNGVFRCPGKKNWKLKGQGVTELNRVSYSMNSFDTANTKGIQCKMASIQEPARTMLVIDTGSDYFVTANTDYVYKPGKLALRHKNADNVLFCDGHVEAVKSGGLNYDLTLKR